MTRLVNDWFKSLAVLAVAFMAVVVATMLVAVIVVPTPTASSDERTPSPGASDAPSTPGETIVANPFGIGGTLSVTGDVEGTIVLDREGSMDGRYTLAGTGARLIFENMPVTVRQLAWDGMEFFLDPTDCRMTPGDRNPATGVADAHLRCEAISDIRDRGTVTVDGTIGIAADLLGLRGDLPDSGGSVTVGPRTLEFEEASIFLGPTDRPVDGGFRSQLQATDEDSSLTFTYDPRSHELALAEIELDGVAVPVPRGTCELATTEVGRINPRSMVVEMRISCRPIDVPELGPVPIDGTLLVDQIETSF